MVCDRLYVNAKLGFKNFYLYSAINPKNGENFTVIASSVTTECMNIFLELLVQHLGNRKAFLVMDCAGLHKSKGLVVQTKHKNHLFTSLFARTEPSRTVLEIHKAPYY